MTAVYAILQELPKTSDRSVWKVRGRLQWLTIFVAILVAAFHAYH